VTHLVQIKNALSSLQSLFARVTEPNLIEKVTQSDRTAYAVGGGFLGFASFADLTTFIQQVGVWFGTALVIVTFFHRLYVIYRGKKAEG